MVKEKIQKAFENLKESLGYSNAMVVPRVEKVVVSSGVGKRAKTNKNFIELVTDRLSIITGQKPAARPAKKSIAGFKIRQGDPVGLSVTLRGSRMIQFLDKLIHVALPRTKDFRGIKRSAVDSMGNLTIGIKEHTIFPEVADEELSNTFGLSIVLVSSAKTRDEAMKYFEYIGIPFAKEKEAK